MGEHSRNHSADDRRPELPLVHAAAKHVDTRTMVMPLEAEHALCIGENDQGASRENAETRCVVFR